MATTHTYVPESQVYSHTETYVLPSGTGPQPLPTSHNYVRPAKQHKGIGATIKDSLNRFSNKAQRSWNEATDERFRRYFGFPFSEQLFGEFWGEVWTGGELIPCSAYVSNNYLCILYKRKDPISKDKVHIKATIALRDISQLQRAVCLAPSAGKTPIIQPITDPSVRADSIICYTTDGKMHQFCKFFNFDNFIHVLEWNWKTVKAGGQAATAAGFPAGSYMSTPTALPNPTVMSNPSLVKETTTTTTTQNVPMSQGR